MVYTLLAYGVARGRRKSSPQDRGRSVTLAETAMPSPNPLMVKTSREQREIRL